MSLIRLDSISSVRRGDSETADEEWCRLMEAVADSSLGATPSRLDSLLCWLLVGNRVLWAGACAILVGFVLGVITTSTCSN